LSDLRLSDLGEVEIILFVQIKFYFSIIALKIYVRFEFELMNVFMCEYVLEFRFERNCVCLSVR
jgi:hypothetical protein